MKKTSGKTNWRIPLTSTLALCIAVFLCIAVLASPLGAQTCSAPGDQTPAAPVPECVFTTGLESNIGTDARNATTGLCPSVGTLGVAHLWPEDFRPAPSISLERDTTQRVAGTFEPNAKNGFELFKSLDVVKDAQDRSRLYSAYSLGIQVWDITDSGPLDNTNFAVQPFRIAFRDGFENHFAVFPPSGEQLNFIEDIAALNVGSKDIVAVSGKLEVGISLWDFTPGAPNTTIIQRYQDPNADILQVRLAEHGGKVYAFGAGGAGLRVYDATEASGLLNVCVEQSGQCPDVYRGDVPVASGSTAYLDTLEVGGRVYVAAAGVGFTLPVEIWEVGDPSVPANVTTRKVWSGQSPNVAGGRGPAFIEHNGHYYLAVVDDHKLKIMLIDECVDGDITTCDTVPPPLVVSFSQNISPSSAILAAAQEFLSFSRAGGTPFLYYGVALTNLQGSDLEQLWNLSSLPTSGGQAPLTTLPEITDGGGFYNDPCNGQQLRYWSHYYHKNIQGLRNMHPRVGKFLTGGPSGQSFFYRSAQTILDVHMFAGGNPSIATELGPGESSPGCMDVDITFDADGRNGCDPTGGTWSWTATATTSVPNVSVVKPSPPLDNVQQIDIEFQCSDPVRCSDAEFTVQATNSACPGALLNGRSVTVKDRRPQVVDPISLSPVVAGNTYDVGQEIDFSAQVDDCPAAQAPVTCDWEIFEVGGSSSIDGAQGASCASFTANTCLESYFSRGPDVFTDDFELGDSGSWSAVVGELFFGGKTRSRRVPLKVTESTDFFVRVTANNSFGQDVSADLPFTLTGSRDVLPNPTLTKSGDQTTDDGVDFTLDTNATEIRWEFQDAGGDCHDDDSCDQVCKYYPAEGCTVINGGKSVNFGWREPNQVGSTRGVTVELGKCGSAPVVLNESVTLTQVPVDVVPVVLTFSLADSAISSGVCRADCSGPTCFQGFQEITCKPNQSIPFIVTTDVDGQGFNLDYDFDWDANGTFEDMQQTTTVTFNTTRATYAVPQVKARIGSALSVDGVELKDGSIRRGIRIQNF